MISFASNACDESLNYIISSEKMVEDVADILIMKFKSKEELAKLKPYKITTKGTRWILDSNPIWKDLSTNKMSKLGGVHIEIEKKTGEILCFTLGK